MNIKVMFRKVFDPRYTDKTVRAINEQSIRKIEDTTRVAKKHAALLRKNGIAYRIVIAAGGDHHD